MRVWEYGSLKIVLIDSYHAFNSYWYVLYFHRVLTPRFPHSHTPILRLVFFNDHTGIMPPESKGITERRVYGSFLCTVECKIKTGIKFGIIFKMIDGGWYDILHYTHDTGYGFYHAGRAQAMTGHGFGGTYICSECMISKNIHNGFDF